MCKANIETTCRLRVDKNLKVENKTFDINTKEIFYFEVNPFLGHPVIFIVFVGSISNKKTQMNA